MRREDTYNLEILNLNKILHIVDVVRTILSPLSLVQNIVILFKTEISKEKQNQQVGILIPNSY